MLWIRSMSLFSSLPFYWLVPEVIFSMRCDMLVSTLIGVAIAPGCSAPLVAPVKNVQAVDSHLRLRSGASLECLVPGSNAQVGKVSFGLFQV